MAQAWRLLRVSLLQGCQGIQQGQRAVVLCLGRQP
jgi:hypothetical protein